jgi:hypothetical protein
VKPMPDAEALDGEFGGSPHDETMSGHAWRV